MANLSVIFNMVDNISQKLSGMGREIGNVADSFESIEDASDSAFDSVSDGADTGERSMQEFAQSIADGMVEAFQEMAQEAGLSEDEIEATMGELPDFFRGIGDGMEQEMSVLDAAMQRSDKKVEELGNEFKDTGRKGKESGDDMKSAMQSVESLLAAGGVVAGLRKIAGAFAECAEEAEKVETAYAKLETIAGSNSMPQLTAQIRDLSSSTGIAAADLADVAYNAISAGTAVEDSVTMAGTASKLATAGFTDTSSALSVLTTAMNAYGDSAGTAMEIADSLITVQNLGVTTVADLSANIGKAIATASAYNVELGNLEASYISITKAGINTAEGTTYISSMLKELGTESSTVAKTIKEETGESFASLMKQGYSLADVLGILYTSCNNDATALMNLWGSAEAGKAANAIVSQGLEQFNDNLVTLQHSAGATEKAYETMADTTEFAHNKMKNSLTNLKVAWGNNLNPMLEGLYKAGAVIFDGIANLVEKCPIITGLVTSIAVTVGILAAAVAGYTIVTKIATAAEAAYTAMLETSAGAMTLKIGLIGAATAAIGLLIYSIMSSTEAEEEMSATTEDMNNELADLTQKHEEAVAAFGETSAEAQELEGRMNELSESIEKNGQTLEEFYDSIDTLVDAHDEIVSSFTAVRDEAEKNRVASGNLINRLKELSTSTDKSSKSQGEMEAIIKRLNQMYPELGISIDDVNGSLDTMAAKIDAVNGATKQAEYEAAQQAYADLIAEQTDLVNKQKEAEYQLQRAREKYSNQGAIQGTWNELWGSGAVAGLEDAQAAYDKITAAVEDNAVQLEEAKKIMEQYQDLTTGNSEEMVHSWDAVSIAIANQKENIEKLAEDYQKAYDSAISSIQGQWKAWEDTIDGVEGPWALWDKVEKAQKVSLDNMQKNMEDQLNYWNSYQDNIDALHERHIAGLDDMVAAIDDGSVEAAAYLAQMATASDDELKKIIQSYQNLQNAQDVSLDDMKRGMQDQMKFWQEYADNLENLHGRNIAGLDALVASMDDGSEESAKYLALMAKASDEELTAMAKQYESLQTAQAQTADDMATLATDYDARLDEIEASFAETVNNMNMEDEAYKAACATLQGYINGIKHMQDYATSAAAAVSAAVNRELGDTGTPSTGVPGHAEGTTFSEPFYLAGEEGPELIKSGGGDVVFPHSETEKILESLDNHREENKAVTDMSQRNTTNYTTVLPAPNQPENVSKTITLNINGSGSIQLDRNVDKEQVWDDVKDTIKDKLYEILADEIYEGSDQVYEY